MKRYDAMKRDNLLAEFLYQHKGAENIVSAKEICDFLKANGYAGNTETINMVIRKLMYGRKLPICSQNAKGYFWAARKAEIEQTVADLQGRIEEMQERMKLLNSFIIN